MSDNAAAVLIMLSLAICFAGPTVILASTEARSKEEAIRACYAAHQANCADLIDR